MSFSVTQKPRGQESTGEGRMASSVPLRLFFAGYTAWLMTLPMVSTAERPYTGSSPGKAVEGCFSIALPCACTFTERNRRQFKLLPN